MLQMVLYIESVALSPQKISESQLWLVIAKQTKYLFWIEGTKDTPLQRNGDVSLFRTVV